MSNLKKLKEMSRNDLEKIFKHELQGRTLREYVFDWISDLDGDDELLTIFLLKGLADVLKLVSGDGNSISKSISQLREILPEKVDYAELVCAEGFSRGSHFVYEDPSGDIIENTILVLTTLQELFEMGRDDAEQV